MQSSAMMMVQLASLEVRYWINTASELAALVQHAMHRDATEDGIRSKGSVGLRSYALQRLKDCGGASAKMSTLVGSMMPPLSIEMGPCTLMVPTSASPFGRPLPTCCCLRFSRCPIFFLMPMHTCTRRQCFPSCCPASSATSFCCISTTLSLPAMHICSSDVLLLRMLLRSVPLPCRPNGARWGSSAAVTS
jgi:hypothetical protein